MVTTIDAEHLDHYGNLDAIRDAFLTFVNKVPFYGAAVLCLDQPNIQMLIPQHREAHRHLRPGVRAPIWWLATCTWRA